MTAHTVLPPGVGRFPHARVRALTIANPDIRPVPCTASSLRCARAGLASSTATVTKTPSYSTRSIGEESVCRNTFSTNTVAIAAAPGIMAEQDQPDNHPPTNRCASTMLLTWGGRSARARRRCRGTALPAHWTASCWVANIGTKRVMPRRRVSVRTESSAQTNTIGTSGHELTCQRTLVKTDHAEASGTRSPLTSTTTTRGASSAALTTVSRSERYDKPSRTPVQNSVYSPHLPWTGALT